MHEKIHPNKTKMVKYSVAATYVFLVLFIISLPISIRDFFIHLIWPIPRIEVGLPEVYEKIRMRSTKCILDFRFFFICQNCHQWKLCVISDGVFSNTKEYQFQLRYLVYGHRVYFFIQIHTILNMKENDRNIEINK